MEKNAPVVDDVLQAVDRNKLLRLTKYRSLGFWIMFLFIIVMTLILANEPLYFFNFLEPDPNIPLSSQFFRLCFYLFIILTFIYQLTFSIYYIKKINSNEVVSDEDFTKFKKRYAWFDLLNVVPVFIVFIIVINGFFLGFAYVEGPSMIPAFHEGDFVVINHATSNFDVGDVIIIQRQDKLIKRIVAVPGDMLAVNTSGVFLNGSLIETIIDPDTFSPYSGIIPAGYYFVMGDNRGDSTDSRIFGLVPVDTVLGKVIYPITSLD